MEEHGVIWQDGYEVLVVPPRLLWRAHSTRQLRPGILSLADARPDKVDALDDLILTHAHLKASSSLAERFLGQLAAPGELREGLQTCEMYFAKSKPKWVLSCSKAAADEGKTSPLKRHCVFSPASTSSSVSDSHEPWLSSSSHMGMAPSWSSLIQKMLVCRGCTNTRDLIVK